tara:strand:- start:3501 stop:3695 length:195 start_codon:yes stop_codon:yes gene_type:complete
MLANNSWGGSNIKKIPINLKIKVMAKDSSGKKFNRIPEHKRKVGGKTITVKEHIRSNRKDSKGK